MHEVRQIPNWNRRVEELPSLGEEPCIHETATILRSRFGSYVEIGPFAEIIDCTIGDYSYVAGVHAALQCTDVGKFCSIASSVRINPVNHPLDRVTQHHCTYRRRQYGLDIREDEELFARRRSQRIHVGHDVWIGHGAIILPGVNIGTGAAIGAGAVVTRDVEPYTIVVGVPARPVRKRFPEYIIRLLLDSRWWDRPRQELERNFSLLIDVERFLTAHTCDSPSACRNAPEAPA